METSRKSVTQQFFKTAVKDLLKNYIKDVDMINNKINPSIQTLNNINETRNEYIDQKYSALIGAPHKAEEIEKFIGRHLAVMNSKLRFTLSQLNEVKFTEIISPQAKYNRTTDYDKNTGHFYSYPDSLKGLENLQIEIMSRSISYNISPLNNEGKGKIMVSHGKTSNVNTDIFNKITSNPLKITPKGPAILVKKEDMTEQNGKVNQNFSYKIDPKESVDVLKTYIDNELKKFTDQFNSITEHINDIENKGPDIVVKEELDNMRNLNNELINQITQLKRDIVSKSDEYDGLIKMFMGSLKDINQKLIFNVDESEKKHAVEIKTILETVEQLNGEIINNKAEMKEMKTGLEGKILNTLVKEDLDNVIKYQEKDIASLKETVQKVLKNVQDMEQEMRANKDTQVKIRDLIDFLRKEVFVKNYLNLGKGLDRNYIISDDLNFQLLHSSLLTDKLKQRTVDSKLYKDLFEKMEKDYNENKEDFHNFFNFTVRDSIKNNNIYEYWKNTFGLNKTIEELKLYIESKIDKINKSVDEHLIYNTICYILRFFYEIFVSFIIKSTDQTKKNLDLVKIMMTNNLENYLKLKTFGGAKKKVTKQPVEEISEYDDTDSFDEAAVYYV
jgi:hypothetical protein